MTSRSSHACFLLYFQKMLLNANGESNHKLGNRDVHRAFPMVRKRRQLPGSSLVSRVICPTPIFPEKAPEKKPRLW
jgi:hypothetical protein